MRIVFQDADAPSVARNSPSVGWWIDASCLEVNRPFCIESLLRSVVERRPAEGPQTLPQTVIPGRGAPYAQPSHCARPAVKPRRGSSAGEDLAGPEVEAGVVVRAGVRAVVEGDREVMV